MDRGIVQPEAAMLSMINRIGLITGIAFEE
jgi:hypothetical protein